MLQGPPPLAQTQPLAENQNKGWLRDRHSLGSPGHRAAMCPGQMSQPLHRGDGSGTGNFTSRATSRNPAGSSLQSQASCLLPKKLFLTLRRLTACCSLAHSVLAPGNRKLTKSGPAISDPTIRNSKYGKRMGMVRRKCLGQEPGTHIPVPASPGLRVPQPGRVLLGPFGDFLQGNAS